MVGKFLNLYFFKTIDLMAHYLIIFQSSFILLLHQSLKYLTKLIKNKIEYNILIINNKYIFKLH